MQTVQWLVTLSLLGFPALSQHNPDPRKPLSRYKPQRRVEETGSYFIDAHMPTHSRPSCKCITQNRTNMRAQLLMSNAKILSLETAWPSSKPPPVSPSDKAHRLDKEHRLAPWPVVERKQIQVETPGEGRRVRERRGCSQAARVWWMKWKVRQRNQQLFSTRSACRAANIFLKEWVSS